MLRKHTAKSPPRKKAKNMPNVNAELQKELERALDQNDSNSRVLHLAQEVLKKPNVPLPLIMRILKFCVKVGSEYVVRQVLSKQTFDLKTTEGNKLLWKAVDKGQVEIATLLVRHGADSNVRQTDDNSTLLHKAVRCDEISDNAKINEFVRLLLDYGADVNACDNNGYSVIRKALTCDECSIELIETLLQRGAEIRINENSNLDDIFWASCYKPLLLPRFIEHQVPDVQTKNQRGFIAIKTLLNKGRPGVKMGHQLQIIQKILDLGVDVNTADPYPEAHGRRRPRTLLSIALYAKRIDAVKLLLEYGADPHQRDEYGHTPLYMATRFAGYTHASRWLIEKGASIHDRDDNDLAGYPIHGACQHQSVKNIHLLVSLGADITVTDKRGHTPFRYTGDTYYTKDYHLLIIKYFALLIAKGGTISDDDMASANKYIWGSHHFNKCTKQLEQMKREYICNKVSYFSLFSENIYKMMQLMKIPSFAKNFKRNEQKRKTLFPQYSYMLLHAFEIAVNRYNILLVVEQQITEALGKFLPDVVIELIAFYSCYEKLKHCQHEYYMTFHANLKNTKADKEKVL